jgi:sacsin
MRRTVTAAAVLESARSIEALAATGDAVNARARGESLFRYLDFELPRLLDPDAGGLGGVLRVLMSPEARRERAAARDSLLTQLRSIAWCPVLDIPPAPGLPWEAPDLATAQPLATRPASDAWLVSGSLRLLACECRSAALREAMGWAGAPALETLCHQLAALGDMHARVDDTPTAQQLAAALPRLYQHLSKSRTAPSFPAAASALINRRCIWVGAGFARPSTVALTGPLNLAPYLHVLPADLISFRGVLSALGVRDAFDCADFASVLQSLADDNGVAALSPPQLELAVWLLQQLAPSPPLGPIWVPGADAVMRQATALTHNDAPWQAAPPDVILCHPLLSQAVSEAVGVRSMRRFLLADSAATLDLGMAEAFGQSEALTTRLRHIIDAYADGPGILNELVQNADDAGVVAGCGCAGRGPGDWHQATHQAYGSCGQQRDAQTGNGRKRNGSRGRGRHTQKLPKKRQFNWRRLGLSLLAK